MFYNVGVPVKVERPSMINLDDKLCELNIWYSGQKHCSPLILSNDRSAEGEVGSVVEV